MSSGRWKVAALTYNVNKRISDRATALKIYEWLDDEKALHDSDIVAIGLQVNAVQGMLAHKRSFV
jgi:hypothetical protein